MSWFTNWFGYGLGAGAAGVVFGKDQWRYHPLASMPVQARTEEQIRADEKRFAEDEKRLDAADAADASSARERGAR